jgi:2-keto-4-pentenoate hydratase/2-oxohepta-3-ene-1,7-dioic acid hydratase in catechol pathway
VDKSGATQAGVMKEDGAVRLIEGNPLGEWRFTGETQASGDIREYLVPADIPAIIALGGNYAQHARECKEEVPEHPLVFLKAITTLNAHGRVVLLPKEAPNEVDYEAELGVVIGRRAKHITPEQAPAYIFGYTCVNDVSARDCQLKIDKQWARGKSFDTFAPVGPVVETELDPANVHVRLVLNGQVMQDGCTSDLVFSVPEVVSYLSRQMTLLPGTLILTGTPEGVGLARDPQVFLQAGDQVVVEIDEIGRLENTVEMET